MRYPRTPIDVNQLILEVQKHDSLYNPENPTYRIAEKNNTIWSIIGAQLNISGAECKVKWKGLRDAYVKKRKLLKTASSQAVRRVKKWKHFQSMSFLDAYIRDTSNNMTADLLEGDEDRCSFSDDKEHDIEDINGNEEDEIQESEVDSVLEISVSKTVSDKGRSSVSYSSTPSPVQKPAKQQKDKDTKMVPIGQLVVDYNEQKRKSDTHIDIHHKPSPDEDELFMLSLLPTLRRLPPPEKALAKFKIHELLFRAEQNCCETQVLPNTLQLQLLDQIKPEPQY